MCIFTRECAPFSRGRSVSQVGSERADQLAQTYRQIQMHHPKRFCITRQVACKIIFIRWWFYSRSLPFTQQRPRTSPSHSMRAALVPFVLCCPQVSCKYHNTFVRYKFNPGSPDAEWVETEKCQEPTFNPKVYPNSRPSSHQSHDFVDLLHAIDPFFLPGKPRRLPAVHLDYISHTEHPRPSFPASKT